MYFKNKKYLVLDANCIAQPVTDNLTTIFITLAKDR